MATSRIVLPIPGGIPPDGTGTINNPMTPQKMVGSGTQRSNTPKVTHIMLLADATTDEHWMWALNWPGDYVSGGLIRMVLMSTVTTTANVVMKAAVAQSTDNSTSFDADNSLFDVAGTTTIANPTTTVGRTVSGTVSLAAGYTAQRFSVIMVGRDADNGSDTLGADVGLVAATLEYTS